MHITIQYSCDRYVMLKNVTFYFICIDGVRHFEDRYQEFRKMHDSLNKAFPADLEGLNFPGKEYNAAPLKGDQLEIRRQALEQYFQKLTEIRNPQFKEQFNNELLNKQKSRTSEKKAAVNLDIHIPHAYGSPSTPTSIKIPSDENYTNVMQKLATSIGLNEQYLQYFDIYLVLNNKKILRKFCTHDAPYITFQNAKADRANAALSLQLRKNYWEPKIDDILVKDRVCRDFLINQLHNDEKEEIRKIGLTEFTSDAEKFDDLRKTNEYYNFLQFNDCISDHSSQNAPCTILVGPYKMYLQTHSSQISYELTRMKSWRLSTLEEPTDNNYEELAFEYLVEPNRYEWIGFLSSQAIFIFNCLRSMAEELFALKLQNKATQRQEEVRDHGDSTTAGVHHVPVELEELDTATNVLP